MNKKPDQLYDSKFEDKRLRAQVLSPGEARGVLCFVNSRATDSIAADIPETEISIEINRFEHMIHTMAKDKHFLKKVIEKIKKHGIAAHIAVEHALQEITAMFEQSDSAYISERAADFKDIAGQLI